jgi:hypothetical protein
MAFGVAALAAAALLFESTLTRLLAVAQFYHFAFLVVSLALLGFGASGSLLGLAPGLAHPARLDRLLPRSAIAFTLSAVAAYAVVNLLPFDSYAIAWERRQVLYFGLYYLALSVPFLFAGLGIGAALAASAGRSHQLYAANLLGSAIGALLAPAALWLAGVPGAVLASGLIALLPGLRRPTRLPAAIALAVGLTGLAALAALNLSDRGPLGLAISPYKGLAHARRFPGSQVVFGRWDAVARADVVANAGTRALPGLSYTFTGLPPPQLGLLLDADAAQPITLSAPEEFAAAAFLPEAVVFDLRPGARTLVLEPGGGLVVLQALAGGAGSVTAVVGHPLVRVAVAASAGAANIYVQPHVEATDEASRAFLRRDRSAYDVVLLALTDPFRPVTGGAYSLAESYSLTVEAMADMLARLGPGGLLVITRWLQIPPSEDLRLVATVVAGLERRGVADPARALVAFRGIQTITVLVQPDGWGASDLGRVREFLEARRYDLVWAPDVRPEEVNRFNRLPAPEHYAAVKSLLAARDRAAFYRGYAFAVEPPTDDRPFFFHFFRWRQTREVLATLGRTWQPFGGSGYFVLFALLALVLALSGLLIGLPLLLERLMRSPARQAHERLPGRWETPSALAYFALLGIGFLFVEIPLIQRSLVVFGQPTYAFTAVVAVVLCFSGIGSVRARARWLRTGWIFGGLAGLTMLMALMGPQLNLAVLAWPALPRGLTTALSLAPLAVLMGLPFPLGLAALEARAPGLIPLAWAVNGCASVVASVLAAILALSFGFTAVLFIGAGAYGAAGLLLAGGLKRPGSRAAAADQRS